MLVRKLNTELKDIVASPPQTAKTNNELGVFGQSLTFFTVFFFRVDETHGYGTVQSSCGRGDTHNRF